MSNFNFDKLKTTEHMLQWFTDKPYSFIIESTGKMLNQHIAGSIVQSFTVTAEPEWLTGFLTIEGDDKNKVLSRAGCAFECAMYVQAANKLHYLIGVYTCVAVHLNSPQQIKQRTWLDLDKELIEIGAQGVLKERIYFD